MNRSVPSEGYCFNDKCVRQSLVKMITITLVTQNQIELNNTVILMSNMVMTAEDVFVCSKYNGKMNLTIEVFIEKLKVEQNTHQNRPFSKLLNTRRANCKLAIAITRPG